MMNEMYFSYKMTSPAVNILCHNVYVLYHSLPDYTLKYLIYYDNMLAIVPPTILWVMSYG